MRKNDNYQNLSLYNWIPSYKCLFFIVFLQLSIKLKKNSDELRNLMMILHKKAFIKLPLGSKSQILDEKPISLVLLK